MPGRVAGIAGVPPAAGRWPLAGLGTRLGAGLRSRPEGGDAGTRAREYLVEVVRVDRGQRSQARVDVRECVLGKRDAIVGGIGVRASDQVRQVRLAAGICVPWLIVHGERCPS
jgi:hypothetical protein